MAGSEDCETGQYCENCLCSNNSIKGPSNTCVCDPADYPSLDGLSCGGCPEATGDINCNECGFNG